MSLCVRHRETFLLHLLSHLSCFVAASWKLRCEIQALAEQDEFLARQRSLLLSPSPQTQSHVSPHVYTSGTAGPYPQLQAMAPHSLMVPVPPLRSSYCPLHKGQIHVSVAEHSWHSG